MDLVDLVAGTEAIDYKDCHDLLASERIGRLGVVIDGQPDIFPVNYGMDGTGIVFRTNHGRKLRGVMSGEVVFEVDHVDAEERSGWSIVVRGQAEDITHFDSRELKERAGSSWSGPKGVLVRISPTQVTGRRVRGQPALASATPLPGVTPR
jgi:nitroimidazol reductase NimA-like FMN-containing flavoprotein (pyridoxamine 5'-phosphate oxidase superfamily)